MNGLTEHNADKTINVLVLPAGCEPAFEIHDALKHVRDIRLFGGTVDGFVGNSGTADGGEPADRAVGNNEPVVDSADYGADLVFKNCIRGFPEPDAPDFVPFLNRVIDAYHIDCIFPAGDNVLRRLSEDREAVHAGVLCSPADTVGICLSKNRTYDILSGASCVPVTWAEPGAVPDEAFPVFFRNSDCGKAHSGNTPRAQKIRDREHLEEAVAAAGGEYSICEYLPGAEYTVDCFTDRQGTLTVIRPRTRERIRAGIAVRSGALEADAGITAIAEELNRRMTFTGAWFFRLKCNSDGAYRLLKIAPRIAGSMGVARALGINLPLLTVRAFTGGDTSDCSGNGNQVLMDRAFTSRFRTDIVYDSVYVDFDDTLVLKEKVNAYLMRFLYQARNQGKAVFLLTRHAADIHTDLAAYRIPEALFTGIISMDRSGSKADYITGKAVFIDDSFAERRQVREKCGIPVFDLDMVESLMDLRA